MQQQRSGEAVELLQRDPLPAVAADLEYHALYAAALQEQKRFEEAGQLYRQLVNLRPQQAVWWMGLAISMDQAGSNEQARGAYEQAIALPGLRSDLHDYIRGRLQIL
jgi:MSHA biogenesis protein MshN